MKSKKLIVLEIEMNEMEQKRMERNQKIIIFRRVYRIHFPLHHLSKVSSASKWHLSFFYTFIPARIALHIEKSNLSLDNNYHFKEMKIEWSIDNLISLANRFVLFQVNQLL